MARKRETRRQAVYQKRWLSRRTKTRKARIVTRKEQPSILRGETVSFRGAKGQVLFAQVEEVKKLSKKVAQGGVVSSSWIALIEWKPKEKRAYMETLDDYSYDVYIPFKMFEEWYYAHSKGTYFNYMIKDKFKVKRV